MSAKGLFVAGFTLDEVKAIQNKAKAMLMEGKTIMNWSDGGGTSVSKQFAMPVADVLEECAYAIRKLDPEMQGRSNASSLSHLPDRLPL